MHQETTKTVCSNCALHMLGRRAVSYFLGEKEAPLALQLSIIKTLLHGNRKAKLLNFSKDCGGVGELMTILQEYEDFFGFVSLSFDLFSSGLNCNFVQSPFMGNFLSRRLS